VPPSVFESTSRSLAFWMTRDLKKGNFSVRFFWMSKLAWEKVFIPIEFDRSRGKNNQKITKVCLRRQLHIIFFVDISRAKKKVEKNFSRKFHLSEIKSIIFFGWWGLIVKRLSFKKSGKFDHDWFFGGDQILLYCPARNHLFLEKRDSLFEVEKKTSRLGVPIFMKSSCLIRILAFSTFFLESKIPCNFLEQKILWKKI